MRLTIFHNAVRGMRVLFDATRKLGIPLENPEKNGVYGSQLLLLDNVAQVSILNKYPNASVFCYDIEAYLSTCVSKKSQISPATREWHMCF